MNLLEIYSEYRERWALTTLAALVVIERPPKNKEPHMINSKIMAPVEF